GIQVTLRYMHAEAFSKQAETDHQQESEAEHDDGRMRVHETGQRFAGDNHQDDRNNDRGHHYPKFVDHPDSGNDRVQRKDGIQGNDLRQYDAESGMRLGSLGMMRAAFEALLKFHRRLDVHEQSPAEPDQVPSGETFVDHPGSGNYRVQRKDGIQGNDLRQYDAESGMRFGSLGMMRDAFEALVKFHRRLEEQEQSSSEQDQVPSGETFAEYREQWVS